jgi:hypothetical protein
MNAHRNYGRRQKQQSYICNVTTKEPTLHRRKLDFYLALRLAVGFQLRTNVCRCVKHHHVRNELVACASCGTDATS